MYAFRQLSRHEFSGQLLDEISAGRTDNINLRLIFQVIRDVVKLGIQEAENPVRPAIGSRGEQYIRFLVLYIGFRY